MRNGNKAFVRRRTRSRVTRHGKATWQVAVKLKACTQITVHRQYRTLHVRGEAGHKEEEAESELPKGSRSGLQGLAKLGNVNALLG